MAIQGEYSILLKFFLHFVMKASKGRAHAYASLIGIGEGLDEDTQFILENAALVHDDAIRAVRKNIFRTQSGTKILDDMFNS